jgi:hypothetical protein
LYLVAGFQCATSNPDDLQISTTSGMVFSLVARWEDSNSGKFGQVALWKALGGGAPGTVTAANAVVGSQATDLRGYSYVGANDLDLQVSASGAVGFSQTGVTGGTIIVSPTFLHATDSDSVHMIFALHVENEEVQPGVTPLYTNIEEFDSQASGGTGWLGAAGVSASLCIATRTASMDHYSELLEDGSSHVSVIVGVSIADATVKVETKRWQKRSRGAQIKANWF